MGDWNKRIYRFLIFAYALAFSELDYSTIARPENWHQIEKWIRPEVCEDGIDYHGECKQRN